MSNIDVDALMRRAFNLPVPPRPVLPKDGEGEDAARTVRGSDNLVFLNDTPPMDGPQLLSDDALDTQAAAGQPGLLSQPGQTSRLADKNPAKKKNWP